MEGRFPAGAGEEVAAGFEISDALRQLSGVQPKFGEISDNLVDLGEGCAVVL